MLTIDPETLILGTPLAIGLVEVAKKAGIPSRLAPATALVMGFASGVVLMGQDIGTTQGATTAVIMGLTAAGLYDQKAIIGPRESDLKSDAA